MGRREGAQEPMREKWWPWVIAVIVVAASA